MLEWWPRPSNRALLAGGLVAVGLVGWLVAQPPGGLEAMVATGPEDEVLERAMGALLGVAVGVALWGYVLALLGHAVVVTGRQVRGALAREE